jgi:hypothetical protein
LIYFLKKIVFRKLVAQQSRCLDAGGTEYRNVAVRGLLPKARGSEQIRAHAKFANYASEILASQVSSGSLQIVHCIIDARDSLVYTLDLINQLDGYAALRTGHRLFALHLS